MEVTFYALLPMVALCAACLPGGSLATRMRVQGAMLATLLALSVAYKLAYLADHDPFAPSSLSWLLSLPAQLDYFAIGMGVAVLHVWLDLRPDVPAAVRAFDRAPGVAWGSRRWPSGR